MTDNEYTTKKLTIDELEGLLQRDEEVELEIMPNGEVRVKGTGEKTNIRPLTMREMLGGEYGRTRR